VLLQVLLLLLLLLRLSWLSFRAVSRRCCWYGRCLSWPPVHAWLLQAAAAACCSRCPHGIRRQQLDGLHIHQHRHKQRWLLDLPH
jgi:hypothetical protein